MTDKTKKPEMTKKTTSEHQNITAQSWLSEYQSLTRFALANWRQRYILVGLNIAAMGTLISLAISTKAPHFIAVLSLVSSALGIIWVAESRWGIKLDNYVRDNIAPAMRALSQDSTVFRATEIRAAWTQNYWELFKNIFTGGAAGAITGLLIFFAPSTVSLGMSIYEGTTKLEWQPWYFAVLVIADGFLLAILIISGHKLFEEWKEKPEDEQI